MSRDRAWGWVAHLRDGGTTQWADWQQPGATGGRWLPGAQQLELLRRLNASGRPPTALAVRVLEASAPGRGRPDLELAGADEAPRFGPSPVDPGRLGDDELLRVACGLLAEDVVAAGRTPEPPPRPPRRRRVRYRLAGDPELAAPLRDALRSDGRPPGGTGAAVHVLGTDVATMLGHAWTAGTLVEGGPAWPDYLAERRQRPGLPRRIDLAAIAAKWRELPGTGRLDVVLDPATLPPLLGVRSLPAPSPVPAAAAELARRTAGALGLLVTPPERAELLRRVLRPRLARVSGVPVGMPEEHLDWVEERADRLRRRLRAAGYPVVGDLDALLPHRTGDRRAEPPGRVLDLALELLLEVRR